MAEDDELAVELLEELLPEVELLDDELFGAELELDVELVLLEFDEALEDVELLDVEPATACSPLPPEQPVSADRDRYITKIVSESRILLSDE